MRSIPALDAFQLPSLTPFNSTLTFARTERPLDGTMFDRATTRPEADAFTSTQLMSIAAQLCDALECMHTLSPPLGPIAHRDVKLDNVLLESSPETEGGLKARIPYTGPHTTASAW